MLLKYLFPIALLSLLITDETLGEQNIKVLRTSPRRNGKVLFKFRCTFKIDKKYKALEGQVKIRLDTELLKFKSKQANVIDDFFSGGTQNYKVTNSKNMKPSKYKMTMTAQYIGDKNTPIPTGTCDDMVFIGTTTSTTGGTTSTVSPTTSTTSPTTSTTSPTTSTPEPTTTTTEPTTTTTEPTTTTTEPTTTTTEPTTTTTEPTTTTTEPATTTTEPTTTTTEPTTTTTEPTTTTTEPTTTTSEPTTTTQSTAVTVDGTVHMVHRDGECNRMYAYCDIPVNDVLSPSSLRVSANFEEEVWRFQQWTGISDNPMNSTPLTAHLVDNKFELRPPVWRYAFKASFSGDNAPSVACSASGPGVTSTTPPTSSTSTSSTTATTSTTQTTSTTPTTSTAPTTSTTPTSTTTQASTTSSATTSPETSVVNGVTYMIYRDGNCNRMYGYCDFPIADTIDANSVQFKVNFNSTVKRFEQWSGKPLYSDEETDQYAAENLFELQPPLNRYAFKATFQEEFSPDISCSMAYNE